jgi:DNA-binding PadR family transcriptional regulator
MAHEIRLSAPALRVLKVLLGKPRERRSGAELSRDARVGSGTLYPLLNRMEQTGWLDSEWEAVEPRDVGRPRRRLYRLTALGQASALAALKEFQFVAGDLAWTS